MAIQEQGWNVWLSGSGIGILSQANPPSDWSAQIRRDVHVSRKSGEHWVSFCGARIAVQTALIGDRTVWRADGGVLECPVRDVSKVKPTVRVRFDARLELVASLHGTPRRRLRGPRHYRPVGSQARV
jgi:hypothetical protein